MTRGQEGFLVNPRKPEEIAKYLNKLKNTSLLKKMSKNTSNFRPSLLNIFWLDLARNGLNS
ncbi:hypothetical protein AKJ52_01830 [candidate division MSBL1 archaeon SCGC-AAA382C18]|uniref:Uncharacterized protein n=1 Tax=candidate division MSBL1 archaeon SCGC-AAA382C18 TaxID=1698281 RepID=A0A133VJR7_9EURY|nr:hypothetical protein AKJ52_01830 [candidate division MSBL1 archaeon SCGC-AAA382C18]